jgi:hypothetical protein
MSTGVRWRWEHIPDPTQGDETPRRTAAPKGRGTPTPTWADAWTHPRWMREHTQQEREGAGSHDGNALIEGGQTEGVTKTISHRTRRAPEG